MLISPDISYRFTPTYRKSTSPGPDRPDLHFNAIGCRGLGEIGITGVAAAIANAVFHATGSGSGVFRSPRTNFFRRKVLICLLNEGE